MFKWGLRQHGIVSELQDKLARCAAELVQEKKTSGAYLGVVLKKENTIMKLCEENVVLEDKLETFKAHNSLFVKEHNELVDNCNAAWDATRRLEDRNCALKHAIEDCRNTIRDLEQKGCGDIYITFC